MKQKTIAGIIFGTILFSTIVFALVSGDCKTAGCMLDKQIELEKRIKVLKLELEEITDIKNKLYVEGITISAPILPPKQVEKLQGYSMSLSGKK